MRYLVFGDIHGNLPALEQLMKLEQNNYDQMICHGDVVNYGPWSNECVDLLSESQDLICLKGNHEEAFIKGKYPGTNPVAKAFFEQCFPGFDRKEEVAEYRNQYKVHDFTVKHTINDKYYFPDTELDSEELESNYIIGHSHYQFSKEHDKKRLINTGSLGQNRKFLNIAEYVLLEDSTGEVGLRSFKTDIDVVIQEMKIQNYPQICLEYYQKKPLLV